jgi:hypothetical protein
VAGLTLRPSVHDHFWNHTSNEEVGKGKGESEASPVVSVFQDLQAVAIEVNCAVEVHFEKGPHWDLVTAAVLGRIGLLVELQVVLDRAPWVFGLLILARGKDRSTQPDTDKDREGSEEGKEDGRLQAATNLPGKVHWYKAQEAKEQEVGEALGSRGIGREGSILDGWVLRNEESAAEGKFGGVCNMRDD